MSHKLPASNFSLYQTYPDRKEDTTESHVLFVDSRFCTGKSNVDFTVNLNDHSSGGYKSVTSVELLGMSMNTRCLADASENYVVLDVLELNSRLDSNSFADDKFCTVYFDTVGGFTKAVKGTDFDRKYKSFEPRTLSKLTVALRNGFTGDVFEDTGYTTFLFKVRTCVRNY